MALAEGQSPLKPGKIRGRPRAIQRAEELQACYRELATALEIGSATSDHHPQHPYNLLLCKKWMVMVRRLKESQPVSA